MIERPLSIRDEGAPVLRILSGAKLQRLHDAAIELLEDPGVQITSEEARHVLLDAGCSPVGDDVLRIPARLVEDALSSAPKTFTLYDRNGEERMFLGEGRAYFGTGVTSLNYEDPATGRVRPFTVEDFEELAKLTDALPNLDFIASPGVVRPSANLPIELVNQHEFLAMVTNTTKPVMALIANAAALEDIFEMASVIAGSREALAERPFVVPYLNSVTPLQFNVETLDKLLLSADHGIPVVCQAAPSMGGTSPVTVAGTAAVAAAETLAGLVIAQQRRRGTPYISGSMPMVMDMRSGQVTGGGAPGHLLYLTGVELARFWGLPQVGSGGSTDSKITDEQAAIEGAGGVLSSILTGADLNFDVGAMDMGLTHSAVLMTMMDERIGEARRMLEGVPTDDESLALDALREVGIGGNFLGSEHTLRHFRELWTPTLTSWESRRDWEAAGARTLGQRARERTLELLGAHRPEPLPEETLAAMRAVIEARRTERQGPSS